MGSRVGPYIVTSTLGQGTFGKVKLAQHQETGIEYAIKILDKSDIKANELTVNVRREIAIMKALNHRNIVNLREVLSSKTKLYIVMDLVRGGELFEQIERKGELDEKLARKYFQQLIDGIDYCHRRGVCHRDLKPENLLVDENGTLKITDFGVSSMKGGLSGSDLLYTACGTPYYCAPEIINGAEEGYSGVKIDAWSCGIILFLLLTGTLPFQNEDMTQLYEQINRCNVDYPKWMPVQAKDLISHLLEKNPVKRYSLEEVKQHMWFLVDYDSNNSSNSSLPTDPASTSGNNVGDDHSRMGRRGSQGSNNKNKDKNSASGHSNNSSNGSLHDHPNNNNNNNKYQHQATPPQFPSPAQQLQQQQQQQSQNQQQPSVALAQPQEPAQPESVLIDRVGEFGEKPLEDLIRAALPGKPEKKINDVCAKLTDLDIDCAEDMQFLAETLNTQTKLREWLEGKSTLPAMTCMRVARFFFK